MFGRREPAADEFKIELGAHGVELIPCHDTPQLSAVTTSYLALKEAIEKMQVAKTKVGLLRGKLSKENQHRNTCSETSVFGAEAVTRLYAFAAARAEFELSILHVEAARTTHGEVLTKVMIRKYFPGSSPDRWTIEDLKEDLPHALQLVGRHNLASACAVLSSLREVLPKYRKYLLELPECPHVLWQSFCAHGVSREYKEIWEILVYGEKNDKKDKR